MEKNELSGAAQAAEKRSLDAEVSNLKPEMSRISLHSALSLET
jgi:hypothetical protein